MGLTDALEFVEKWTNNSADQFKVLLGNKSMDDFLEALAKNLNSTWVPVSDKIKTITSGGITITFNKLSNSGYPTLDIFINGLHFKIRF
ncbi:MAG: hypothetical protein HOP11_11890 [Saprospiraceae bacterium]|nr:hypothetical protein [Saprospiraceae bacterium]